jgi:hypothetical protein
MSTPDKTPIGTFLDLARGDLIFIRLPFNWILELFRLVFLVFNFIPLVAQKILLKIFVVSNYLIL